MAERWQQWMPFHIDRFRGSPDVQAMHPCARAGLLYLLASCWQSDDCTVSADPLELAAQSGLGDELWATHGTRILRKFYGAGQGRLTNAVLREEWERAKTKFDEGEEHRAAISQKRREAGLIGNEKRWGGRVALPEATSQPDRNCDTNDRKAVAKRRLTGTGTGTGTGTKGVGVGVVSSPALPERTMPRNYVDDIFTAEEVAAMNARFVQSRAIACNEAGRGSSRYGTRAN